MKKIVAMLAVFAVVGSQICSGTDLQFQLDEDPITNEDPNKENIPPKHKLKLSGRGHNGTLSQADKKRCKELRELIKKKFLTSKPKNLLNTQ